MADTMKLTRDKYILYIDTSFGGETPTWFKIGKSLSSLAMELNPDVSTEKNILGETYVVDNGYTPQASVDPYYATAGDGLYEKLKDIAMNRKTGDACRTKIMEVVVDSHVGGEVIANSHSAWIEDVIVKPTSFGGDTAGITIPFEIYLDGNRQSGEASYSNSNYKTGTPSFTPVAGA